MALATVGTFSGTAAGSERRFTYTYESTTLPRGHVELEPWTTYRVGRERYYSRFDQRLELELGITDRLMAAWYLNLTGSAMDVADEAGTITRQSELELAGVSTELKLKLSDPVANALGSALYLEGTIAPAAAELEGKVILDRRFGPLYVAGNLVGELAQDWETRGEVEREVELEALLAAAWLFGEHGSVGVELRQVNELEGGSELESSVLYGGPAVSYVAGGWWTAFTVLPQLAALSGASSGRSVDLEHHERLQLRLLVGAHL